MSKYYTLGTSLIVSRQYTLVTTVTVLVISLEVPKFTLKSWWHKTLLYAFLNTKWIKYWQTIHTINTSLVVKGLG